MTIKTAYKRAKEVFGWPEEPTSVNIGFLDTYGAQDETQVDIYSDNPVKELTELWDSLYEEMESAPDSVLYVEALGYISE